MNPLIAAQVGKSLADIFSGAKSGQPVDMSTFKEAMDSIRNLYENYQDAKNLHLSNYIKKSMVSSRVFIQRTCAEEPILNDLLGSIQQLYLSWILTAIDMNKYVDGTRTIRNMLDVVATEAMEYNLPMQDDNILISGLASYNGYQPKLATNPKTGTPVLGNTSAYFIKNNNLYLLDCGELVFHQLYERGMLTRYDRIYSIITHLHADHVGSLGSLISYTYFVLGKKVRVIHPEESVRQLLDLTGIDRNAYYFEQCTRYESDGIVFEAVPVRHAEDMNCYGYIIEDGGRRIYYSGDSYEIPEHVINGFLERRIEKIYQDTTNKVSSHRSHFPLSELKELIPEELRAQVFCMHFGCDFSAEIEQLGFNNAEKYLAQQR